MAAAPFKLEAAARSMLNEAVQQGRIWRYASTWQGVQELLQHGLLVKVKETVTRIYYEPTEAGQFVAKQLPSRDMEWQYAFSTFEEYNAPDHIRHREYSLPATTIQDKIGRI